LTSWLSAISFAWDLPDGPLQQLLAPAVGVRRLLPQAEAEEQGALLDVLDERAKTVARIRIASGARPATATSWSSPLERTEEKFPPARWNRS
jgi:hypothetical protein